MDCDRFSSDDLIGEATVSVSDLLTEGHSIQLTSDGQEDCGTIRIDGMILHRTQADYMRAILEAKGKRLNACDMSKKVTEREVMWLPRRVILYENILVVTDKEDEMAVLDIIPLLEISSVKQIEVQRADAQELLAEQGQEMSAHGARLQREDAASFKSEAEVPSRTMLKRSTSKVVLPPFRPDPAP